MLLNPIFGFSKIPFRAINSIATIFRSSQVNYIEERFKDFIITKGIFLFLGESGSGKTTLIQHVLFPLNQAQYKIIYLNSYPINPTGFLRLLVRSLDFNPKFFREDLIAQFNTIILDLSEKSKLIPFFIFDEAQNMSDSVLEQIRLFTTFDLKLMPLISVIAHAQFKTRLKLACYFPFKQRVSLSAQLAPLNKDELQPYIQFHLTQAGVSHTLFSDDAITLIFNHSKGIPRLINNLCLESLYLAAHKNSSTVNQIIVEDVINAELI